MKRDQGLTDGLDERKSLLGSFLQVVSGFFTVKPVEQFPSGIRKPGKRRTVLADQEALVFADPQTEGGRFVSGELGR